MSDPSPQGLVQLIDMSPIMRVGDKLTIGGVYATGRNPDRRWWQVWKPRMVETSELQTFVIKIAQAVENNQG